MSTIKQHVMANVGIIYVSRVLVSVRALSLFILAASLAALWKLVWVHKVLENFSRAQNGGTSALGTYIMSALSHAHLGVQLALVCSLIAFAFFASDLVRAATPKQSFAF